MESVSILGFWSPGPIELIVVGIILLLIFGKKLPDLARGLGKSFVEFKRGFNDAKQMKDDVCNEIKDATNTDTIIKPEKDKHVNQI